MNFWLHISENVRVWLFSSPLNVKQRIIEYSRNNRSIYLSISESPFLFPITAHLIFLVKIMICLLDNKSMPPLVIFIKTWSQHIHVSNWATYINEMKWNNPTVYRVLALFNHSRVQFITVSSLIDLVWCALRKPRLISDFNFCDGIF